MVGEVNSTFLLKSLSDQQISSKLPKHPGGSKRKHLDDVLELQFNSIKRLCENSHVNRQVACPLSLEV